jgi:hypothetical protein
MLENYFFWKWRLPYSDIGYIILTRIPINTDTFLHIPMCLNLSQTILEKYAYWKLNFLSIFLWRKWITFLPRSQVPKWGTMFQKMCMFYPDGCVCNTRPISDSLNYKKFSRDSVVFIVSGFQSLFQFQSLLLGYWCLTRRLWWPYSLTQALDTIARREHQAGVGEHKRIVQMACVLERERITAHNTTARKTAVSGTWKQGWKFVEIISCSRFSRNISKCCNVIQIFSPPPYCLKCRVSIFPSESHLVSVIWTERTLVTSSSHPYTVTEGLT